MARARRLATLVILAAAAIAAAGMLALTVGPRFLPYQALTIEGGSMSPSIPLGSEMILRPAGADRLEVGDVITFHRPGRPSELVTHRIVRIQNGLSGRSFVTKGDANSVPDAWRVPADGAGWRYTFRLPYVGYGVEASRTPIARFALLALVALVLATSAVRRVWSPA